MSIFSHIVNNTFEYSKGDKLIKYDTYVNEKIVAPFDGRVINVNEKEGCVQIEHYVDRSYIFSNICGIGKIKVYNGEQIFKKDIIGWAKNENVSFQVVNKQGENQKITPFFQDEKKLDKPEKETKSTKKEKEDLDKKHKEELKKLKDNQDTNKPKLGLDKYLVNIDGTPNLPISLLSLPFTLAGGMLSNKGHYDVKEKKKRDEKKKEILKKHREEKKAQLQQKKAEKEVELQQKKAEKEAQLQKKRNEKEAQLKKKEEELKNKENEGKIKIDDLLSPDKKLQEQINRIKNLMK